MAKSRGGLFRKKYNMVYEKWDDQRGRCCYCYIPMTIHLPPKEPNGRDFTLDHIKPRSKGGKNNRENLVLSCYRCNIKKANKHHEDFIKSKWMVKKRLNVIKQAKDYPALSIEEARKLLNDRHLLTKAHGGYIMEHLYYGTVDKGPISQSQTV